MTSSSLTAPAETVDFCGLRVPVARREADGTIWVKAIDAAKVLGMSDALNGRDAARMVDDENKGGIPVPTLGGEQIAVCIKMEGLLQMAVSRRGEVGTMVREALVGFTLAASRVTAPAAAPFLSVPEMRAKASLLNAEARLLREKRLSIGLPAPITQRGEPTSEAITETLLRHLPSEQWIRKRELLRKFRWMSATQIDAALRHLSAHGKIEVRSEPHNGRGGRTSMLVRVSVSGTGIENGNGTEKEKQ